MLKREVAEKRLKEFRKSNNTQRQRQRVSALPQPFQAPAWGLLGCRPDGKSGKDYEEGERLQNEALAFVEGLSPEEREQIFEALCPRLGAWIECGWQLHARLPYQSDYTRRPFRSPGRPEALRESRRSWLESLVETLAGYEQDVAWVAEWAAYLAYSGQVLGILLAAAVETGGPEGDAVFRILQDSARGEHEIGAMGRHVTTALLCAARPEGWEFIEKLLLAAQRQEGLRQVILETVDEAHPEAFRRMLRVILEHDLLRFSSVLRAYDVWLGFEAESWTDAKAVLAEAKRSIEQLSRLLEDPAARAAALGGDEPRAAYLALWALAFQDVDAAIGPAAGMLQDPAPEKRFAAAHLLRQLEIRPAKEALLPALEDPDLRVAMTALAAVTPDWHSEDDELVAPDLFERLERLIERCPKKTATLEPILWPWTDLEAGQQEVARELIATLGDRSPARLIPYLGMMETFGRAEVAERLCKAKSDPAVRQTLFSLVGDTAEYVREKALDGLKKQKVRESEALGLEKLLTRKSGDLRRGVLTLLLNQKDEAALASADRLLQAGDAQKRLAGLELLQQLAKAERAPAECRARAEAYRAARPQRSEAEEKLIDAFLDEEREVPTLDNALGLMDPALRTPPRQPQGVDGCVLLSDTGRALLKSLDGLVHAHRETPIRIRDSDPEEGEITEEEELLGNVHWGFPSPQIKIPIEQDAARLPLRELWENWYVNRPESLRDPDGFELLRAAALIHSEKAGKLKYEEIVGEVVEWLLLLQPPSGAADYLLDAVETSLSQISPDVVARVPKANSYFDLGWRAHPEKMVWVELARTRRRRFPAEWTEAHFRRLWPVLRWIDEPGPPVPRFRPELEEALLAHAAGAATEADLVDLLLGPRTTGEDYWGRDEFEELQELTGRKGSPLFERFPHLRELVERCRQRIIEVELHRGDLPTAATLPALSLKCAGGADVLVRLVHAFGKGTLVRGWIYNDEGKAAVFSTLIRATFPAEGETPEAFAGLAREAGIPEKRLIEVAFYAPQWAAHVEAILGWPSFAEAVWWIHAHTKDQQWSVDEEIREAWEAQVSERTPLTAQSLIDGAVDVEWFHRIFRELGEERWKALDEAAKYASGGGGHKRAQLFADAMLGRADRERLVAQIEEKRNQDALRALGLLPLPQAEAREAEVLARYQVVQEFLRGSKQFGSQRQASEKLAASVSLENLARTAGFADPARLEWAMEAREIADLAAGPVVVQATDVSITLSINALGEADLSVAKNGKILKTIPAAVKKEPAVVGLQERKRAVDRQTSRMRASLESAMCRGDRFTGAELRDLFRHPVLAPMLRNLVFVGEGRAGYPVESGRFLEQLDGSAVPVSDADVLRIAHPHDLFLTGEWDRWQRDCFRRERVQPFKQVFRELYVLTETEQADGVRSRRYAGHQVNSGQAMALLGKRGWISSREDGEVRRTFHAEGLTAWLEFDYGWTTPAEVEGLTIAHVGFTRRGEWKPLPLSDVPPRVFSETMRDLDLVVSVAHQGGVDPEATASTVEMRASLLRETCALLRLANVRFSGSHALIDGSLGTYSVHLGSAVVHRQPGGHVCIVPVHSQHRGRIFLPFADSDPRTAEVVSKVLLLAKDSEIQDPTILEQIL